MLKKLFIILCLFVLVGCSQAPEQEPEEPIPELIQKNPEELLPEKTDTVVCAEDLKQCEDGSFVSRNTSNNCEFDECPLVVKELSELEKIQQNFTPLTSYAYYDQMENYLVERRGDITRVTLEEAEIFGKNKFRYFTIYLFHNNQTAYGYCVDSEYRCRNHRTSYVEVDYDDFLPVDPYESMLSITDAELSGTQGCERRQCDIFTYTENGKDYKLYLRQKYFLPYKITEVLIDGEEENVFAYYDARFNSIGYNELNPPKGRTLLTE